jgi:hypothetical protein
MINTLITINGSQITDFERFRVEKAIGDANISSNFEGRLNNMAGRNADKYNIGDNIQVYSALNGILPGSNPIAQWRFNEGTGSIGTDSVNGYIGSFVSGIQW